MLITPEEELREQRQALNAALNKHDLEAVTSFLHPDFVAKGSDGHSYNRQEAVQQLEQFLQPSFKLHSQVVVEHVEVSDDNATLRVRRTESGRMYRPGVFWGFLAAAAVTAWQMIQIAVRYAPERSSFQSGWVLWVGIGGGAIGFVCFITGAFYLGRRSICQTQRAQETWRLVDGRWLLAGEEPLS